MDNLPLLLAVMAGILLWATFSAWRQGNETRDLALLGTLGGLFGLGSALSALH
jgi:hypothetical protein